MRVLAGTPLHRSPRPATAASTSPSPTPAVIVPTSGTRRNVIKALVIEKGQVVKGAPARWQSEFSDSPIGRAPSAGHLADRQTRVLNISQDAAQVWAALGSLQLEFREILALKYLRGYDYQALSTLLGIPRGTVMSRL